MCAIDADAHSTSKHHCGTASCTGAISQTQPMQPLGPSDRPRGEGLSALVLRCGVQALSVEDGVRYRGALKFDDRRDWTREVGTLAG